MEYTKNLLNELSEKHKDANMVSVRADDYFYVKNPVSESVQTAEGVITRNIGGESYDEEKAGT